MSIKPTPIAEQPSPLESLAFTLKLLAHNRALLGGVPGLDPIFHEDLELFTADNVIVGLRSQWARRVAVPILLAQRAMERDRDPADNARLALEILRQCTDENIKATCSNWLRERYNVR